MAKSDVAVWSAALEDKYEPMKIEEYVRQYWERINIKDRLRNMDSKNIVGFVEGPPTLNGRPHIGHLRGRLLKDLWHRHETMTGSKVLFRGGWDTQGLPVELEAEKELGLKGSKYENLKQVGEERLVEECKKLIQKYHELWLKADRLLGLQMDDEHAYWTYRDDYIEREWQYLKAAYEKGLLGEGYKVVPYCPSCQTSLSHAEVGLGYDMVDDPSLYYKAKLEGREEFLIVWTTMPFTVITDELVAVNPEERYAIVKVGNEKWIMGNTRLDAVLNEARIKDWKVENIIKGKEMQGWKYVPPLLEEVTGQMELYKGGKVHQVVAEDFVDPTTGSGIVHLSPANGEEDYEVANKRSLPVFSPFDDRVYFTAEAGTFNGLFARDADEKVIEILRKKGLLVFNGKIRHEYPLCWRSGHKLVYLLRREYFYWVDRITDVAIRAAEGVEYFYEQPKNRFLGIIKEARPWNISRERVWGAPLPVWVCSRCRNKTFLWSRKEIVKNAVKLPDGENFELHRPWIDRVVIRCPKCGGESFREPFVLDTWHNSGAAPYASMGEDQYSRLIPVPYLTEGIDQTRGWAYTLLVENVIKKDAPQAPYQSFLFQGLVLDEKGEKMSKSKGNTVDWLDLLSSNSTDLVRFYLLWKASPIDALSFDQKEMYKRPFQVLNTLYNLHLYYKTNSSYDSYTYSSKWIKELKDKSRRLELHKEDLWVLSKLNSLVTSIQTSMIQRRYHEATRLLEQFIIETLSQQYIPMTRNSLWDDSEEGKPRRFAIYTVLAHSLESIDRLLHPLTPFITEYLHKCVFYSKEPLILMQYPNADQSAIDKHLEFAFDKVWVAVSLINATRMKSRIKRRWPLPKAILYGLDLSEEYLSMIAGLVNVRDVIREVDLSKLPLHIEVRLSPQGMHKVGRYSKDVIDLINKLSKELYRKIIEKRSFALTVEGREYTLSQEDLTFSFHADKDYEVAEEKGVIAIIHTKRDAELAAEGVIRDVARRLQALRKDKGYKPTEILEKAKVAQVDEETYAALLKNKDRLMYLVRVKSLDIYKEKPDDGEWFESELDGKKIYLYI
ncbi:MAG: isoleucine--tRNA ligase [Nitrososphaerota archaeon]